MRPIEEEARRATAAAATTRYGEAINRYLTAGGYRGAAVPRPPAHRTATGVVVVGVDETPTSYTAVDHAAVEAELRGWDLRLVHVQHSYEISQAAKVAGEDLLSYLAERVHAAAPGMRVSRRLAVGAAAPLLLAEAYNADLVVVGHRHRATGVAFGLSVADRVAAHHTGPVLVVRVPDWPPELGFGSRPLVAGVDDDTPPGVLAFAVAEATARGCDLVVLHAGVAGAATHRAAAVAGVSEVRLVPGDPLPALVEASGQAAAVVVGRRGPGCVAEALLGSVSRGLVQHARCPVFLVR
ncbi:UspA domain-containing protein [Actinoplanes sp. N902-109]|nr:UspA domain-containing protein [Actinoplanes sp. N902-109]